MDKAIVCVDDEPFILKSLKEQLKRRFGSEYLYEVAESAEEALEVLEELQDEKVSILVIVSDWLMPGMKGDELLVEVHRRFPGIVKVLLTGQANEDAIDRARKEADLYCCLRKPWSEEELSQVIVAALP